MASLWATARCGQIRSLQSNLVPAAVATLEAGYVLTWNETREPLLAGYDALIFPVNCQHVGSCCPTPCSSFSFPFHYNNRFILATACYQHVPADRITDRIVTAVLQKT
jgi:hypothetical protein